MSTQQPPAEVVGGAPAASTATNTDHSANSKKLPHQGGGRSRGGSRVSSRGHQGQTPAEETMQASAPLRKKGPSSYKDKDPKSRPSYQRLHVNHKDGSKTGGGTSQHSSRGKSGESGHTHYHTNRHRTGNGSVDSSNSSVGGKADSRIWSSNRFEKLELDPEQETSSTSLGSSTSDWIKSSPSTSFSSNLSTSTSSTVSNSCSSKGADERRPPKERNSRSGRGNPRSRGPIKSQEFSEAEEGVRSAGLSSDINKPVKETTREDGSQRKKSPKQIKFDLPSETEGGLHLGKGHISEHSVSEGGHVTSHEQTKTSTSASEEVARGDGVTSTGGDGTETKRRIVYDREFLIAFKDLSFLKPPELEMSDISFDSTFQKDSIDSSDENRPKHPTALSLIKEHDKHFVSKVSLSPQRRSFQRGCSWKDRVSNSTSSETPLKTPPPKFSSNDNQSETHFKFDGSKSQGRQGGPRVIHHVPLYDQGQGSGKQGKKNWREGGWKGSSGENHHRFAEPEPEWMEFGPSDRYEVIELKGFDDNEIEKDGIDPAPNDDGADQEDLPQKNDHPNTPEKREEDPCQKLANKDPDALLEQPDDNEFILDGFDFSTGVSICQELDLDEDEVAIVNDSSPRVSSTGSKPVQDPSELGSVLMKALGVGKKSDNTVPKLASQHHINTGIINNQVISSSHVPPANALTLDEVHARENIQPAISKSSMDGPSMGEGMEAFNKLLAVLESKQNPPKEDYPSSAQNYPTSGHGSNPVQQKMMASRLQKPMKPVIPSYGYTSEKELLDIDMEEDLPGSNMMFPEPNLRRLEQLERMLENMDRMDPNSHNVPPPSHSSHPPPHRRHQMDQRVPMHPAQLDRDGRGWMHYQQDRGRSHPTPQQLAAARQHQMLTNSRGANNNWAVEMEQRRVMELRQMQQLAKEKELYGGGPPPGSGAMGPQGYGKGSSSKPNISLLPTAVMRHIHTNKLSQSAADLPKTTSISNRLDQELTSKASQTHSLLNTLLNHNPELTPGPNDYTMHGHQMPHAASMRMAPPTGHAPPKQSDLPPTGSVYPHYHLPLPHGMPVRNPYMY